MDKYISLLWTGSGVGGTVGFGYGMYEEIKNPIYIHHQMSIGERVLTKTLAGVYGVASFTACGICAGLACAALFPISTIFAADELCRSVFSSQKKNN